MSRPWRPPRCREHHQLWKPQYTYNTRGNMAMTGSSNSCRGEGCECVPVLPLDQCDMHLGQNLARCPRTTLEVGWWLRGFRRAT